MKKVAILFAGQGAQYVGMGQDFYLNYPEARNIYFKASMVLGYDLASVCFEKSDKLNHTLFTQPAIITTSLAIYETLKSECKINPYVVAGFSLGEYSAIYASGVFSLESTIKLVNERALFMEKASENHPGSMAAIIGIEPEKLNNLCEEIGNIYIANYNSPSQLVVSGTTDSIQKISEIALTKGARRVIKLNVSGAFHTPFMKEAADKMYNAVLNTDYKEPQTKVIMNCNAEYLDIKHLPELLKAQITSPVYFVDMIKKMNNENVDLFIEIGPGKVLKGLIQRIDPTSKVIAINTVDDLSLLKEVKL